MIDDYDCYGAVDFESSGIEYNLILLIILIHFYFYYNCLDINYTTVACRLLSYDAKAEAKELLTHACSRCQLMRTEKGILALLAASVDINVWQVNLLHFIILIFFIFCFLILSIFLSKINMKMTKTVLLDVVYCTS